MSELQKMLNERDEISGQVRDLQEKKTFYRKGSKTTLVGPWLF